MCAVDGQGCATGGDVVTWSTRCVSFGVQLDGSPKRGISYDAFDQIVRTAFEQWVAVDCGAGQHPSLSVWDMGDSIGAPTCNKAEYNQSAPNANVWLLRDSDWPYTDPGSHYAHTSLTYEALRGRLLDADVEINSFGVELTTSNDDIVADLQSIATHEAGHFLGLANSSVGDATMSAAYSPASRAARSLSADDQAGICALYPPDRDVPACSDPSPNHGFSRFCAGDAHTTGCSLGRVASNRPHDAALATMAMLGLMLRRQRSNPRMKR
jgi:hypothetical protein